MIFSSEFLDIFFTFLVTSQQFFSHVALILFRRIMTKLFNKNVCMQQPPRSGDNTREHHKKNRHEEMKAASCTRGETTPATIGP